jgi:hypothetical protein
VGFWWAGCPGRLPGIAPTLGTVCTGCVTAQAFSIAQHARPIRVSADAPGCRVWATPDPWCAPCHPATPYRSSLPPAGTPLALLLCAAPCTRGSEVSTFFLQHGAAPHGGLHESPGSRPSLQPRQHPRCVTPGAHEEHPARRRPGPPRALPTAQAARSTRMGQQPHPVRVADHHCMRAFRLRAFAPMPDHCWPLQAGSRPLVTPITTSQ